MEIKDLNKQLREKEIRKLYLFYGPEEYLKKYYVESIKKIALTGSLTEMNYIVLEGKQDMDRLRVSCETVPILSERKIVVVKNSGLLKSGKNNEASSSLLSLLQDIPDYTSLIFYEEEIDKRIKAAKYIIDNGAAVEFTYQKAPDLVKWVIKVFKSYKKDIDTDTAAYLVENSEQGMTEILNEIDKLNAYLGDRSRVDIADIDRVCTKSIKGRIFDLTDAIAEGNGEKAYKLLDDMIVLREPVQKIQFMISRQLTQLYKIKLLSRKGISTADISKELGIPSFVCNKILKTAGGFTEKQLKKALERSLEMDVAIKTGKIGDRTAVELIIAELSK